MARRATGNLTRQAEALGLIAEHGSVARAANAAGIARSTFWDLARGLSAGAAQTVEKLAGAVTDTVREVGNLIVDVAGGQQSRYVQTARSVSRQAPERTAEQLQARRAQQTRAGLDVNGQPLPTERPTSDSQGRPITDRQNEKYEELLDLYSRGELDSDRYARFASYQLGSGSGGTDVPIEDLA